MVHFVFRKDRTLLYAITGSTKKMFNINHSSLCAETTIKTKKRDEFKSSVYKNLFNLRDDVKLRQFRRKNSGNI